MSRLPPKYLIEQRRLREHDCALRSLTTHNETIDLCSNDYLGTSQKLAQPEVYQRILQDLGEPHSGGYSGPNSRWLGATGSRLVSGNREPHLELESFLAKFHGAESALIFGSGYEANIGLLSSIAGRDGTIIYDELVHASMRDGIRLSPARSYSFRHNDLEDLTKKIRAARGECFIAVESIYSMDGDRAPLAELCNLADSTGAFLVIDEAHATGVFGDSGAGCVSEEGLNERVFARVYTFGKALGYRGACVVGGRILSEHLVNSARSFIYTTAPDILMLKFIREAYELISKADEERNELHRLIEQFRAVRREYPELSFLESKSPIQGVVIPGNQAALYAESRLKKQGFAVRAIRAPTVPAGLERIRLCLHSYNSLSDLTTALSILGELKVSSVGLSEA